MSKKENLTTKCNTKKEQHSTSISSSTDTKRKKKQAGKEVKKRKKKQHVNVKKIIMVFLFTCISLGLITYPFVSNYVFEHQAAGIVEAIEEQVDDSDPDGFKDELDAATKYNETLASGNVKLHDPFDANALEEDEAEYDSLLNMTDDGVMGVIKIPSIDVSLPLYHGTSERVLEKGVGHLQGTSLPIGGNSTHSVLTGHTGLSRAKLFSDLTELKENDYFFIYTMGEKLAYKVDKISVVLPEEISNLTIVDGKDYCTLVTCTPYGVNSHRLLVRGERTEYPDEKKIATPEQKAAESQWTMEYAKSIVIGSTVFLVLMVLLIAYRYAASNNTKRRKRKKRKGSSKKPKKRSKTHTKKKQHSSSTEERSST